MKRLHRLVAEAFIGSVEGLEVHHKDRDKENNRADNLEVLTKAEHDKRHRELEEADRQAQQEKEEQKEAAADEA